MHTKTDPTLLVATPAKATSPESPASSSPNALHSPFASFDAGALASSVLPPGTHAPAKTTDFLPQNTARTVLRTPSTRASLMRPTLGWPSLRWSAGNASVGGLRLGAWLLLVLGSAAFIGACAGGETAEDEQQAEENSNANMTAGPFADLSFRLSNLDFSALPERERITEEDLQDVVVSENITVDHERFDTQEGAAVRALRRVFPQDSGHEGFCEHITAYFFKSLTIEEGVTVRLTGENPIALVALEDINVMGNLFANAEGRTPGPGAVAYDPTTPHEGPEPDPGKGRKYFSASTSTFSTRNLGAHGGHHCGSGGTDDEASMYGRAVLEPLLAGSAGGRGRSTRYKEDHAHRAGGAGGGALQLSAGGAIQVNGTVHAGGGGGMHTEAVIMNTKTPSSRLLPTAGSSAYTTSYAGGGGSGGSILIEAPDVSLSGALASNGGYGGFMLPAGTMAPALWGLLSNPVSFPTHYVFNKSTTPWRGVAFPLMGLPYAALRDASSTDQYSPHDGVFSQAPVSWRSALDDQRGAYGGEVNGRLRTSGPNTSPIYDWIPANLDFYYNRSYHIPIQYKFYSGGGGGAGWIHVKTASGEADLGEEAVLSPYASTQCTTFATLHPPR